MDFKFKIDETIKINNHFGPGYDQLLLERLKHYGEKWTLSNYEWIESCSANVVFFCVSKKYGYCVLKLHGGMEEDKVREILVLRALNDKVICCLYESDETKGDMLIEGISPGVRLRKLADYKERLKFFINLYKKIHKTNNDLRGYSTYLDWLEKVANNIRPLETNCDIYKHTLKSITLYKEMLKDHDELNLLHGDFHHDNILLNEKGTYTVIDPKGVMGPKIFDLPRYILNEFSFDGFDDDMYLRINDIIKVLSERLPYTKLDISKSLYIETVLMASWMVEDSDTPRQPLLNTIEFSEKIMDNYK